MQQTEERLCPNCEQPVTADVKICPYCGFPTGGSDPEKREYHLLLLNLKGWMPEAQKAVNSMLSFALIFFGFSVVALAFSLLFRADFYYASLFYLLLGGCYTLLYMAAKKIHYKAVLLALLFYTAHTIYEFSSGMVLPDMSRGKVQDVFQIMFKYSPFVYIVFRILLFSAFIRGIYFINKIEKHPVLYKWLRRAGEKAMD